MCHVCHILYAAAGKPEYPAPDLGVCRVCGCDGHGVLFGTWVRDTFTDFDKLVPGRVLCPACQFCFEEASDLLRQRVGKEKPQKMRNYSHLVTGGAWHPLTKGQKREMRDLLPAADVAIIATSGQKHIIFRAQPGWWQLEEQAILPDVARWQAIQALVDGLYAVFTKDEIETGRYEMRRIRQFGIIEFQEIERQIVPLRGSLLLQLALFLAQREETNGTPGDSGATAVPAVAGDTRRLQTQIRDERLGAVPEPDQERGLYQQTFDFF